VSAFHSLCLLRKSMLSGRIINGFCGKLCSLSQRWVSSRMSSFRAVR